MGSSGSGGSENSNFLRKFAMFMAGFSFLQVLRVAITAGRFTVVRFGIPSDKIGIFINSIHHSMETAGDVGLVLMLLYTLIARSHSNHDYTVSLFAIWGLFVMNLLLIVAYSVGGEQGSLTFYYWALVITSLGSGLDESISTTVGVADVAYFALGVPLSGIMACLYHVVYLRLAEKFQWRDTYFWIVIGQLVISTIVSGIAAIVWSFAYQGSSSGKSNDTGDLGPKMGNAISNILMCTCGMSCIYAFYPAIAPYQFLSPKAGHKVDLAVLFTSAIPPLINAALCSAGIGPDKKWSGGNICWHFTWVFAIPYLAAILLCIFAMHYPNWRTSRSIYGNIRTVGAISVTLKCCEETLKGVANSGVGMQEGEEEGRLPPVTAVIAQFTMDAFSYVGGGYLKAFKKYESDPDNWPTKHYSRLRAFWFWTWTSIKGGFKSIGGSFTTDIRSNLVAEREYLFIVYTEG